MYNGYCNVVYIPLIINKYILNKNVNSSSMNLKGHVTDSSGCHGAMPVRSRVPKCRSMED